MNRITKASEQGPRRYQEDRFVYQPILNGETVCGYLLAVMDGHGGSAVADFCKQELDHPFHAAEFDEPEQNLYRLASTLAQKTRDMQEGSTLSLVCIREDRCLAVGAVIGDSPVLICDASDTLHWGPSHNVRTNQAELEACQRRGGEYFNGRIHVDENNGIQLSRALGDVCMGDIISREPEMFTVQSPCWILVASDGLVDPTHYGNSVAEQEIASLAKRKARAEILMQRALQRGLEDNATALVWRQRRSTRIVSTVG